MIEQWRKLLGLNNNNKESNIDSSLLEHFRREIWNKVPHLEEEKPGEVKVVNATPLIDITEDLRECARKEYGLDLANRDLQVFGKFDSNLLAGSIKVRPAVYIIHDAIAPGMKMNPNVLAAKATASNIRSQLAEFGFDPAIFDKSRSEVEGLLASADIINLAKLLAKIYGCFCPEQYDNELNIDVHRTVTGLELDQQLREQGHSLSEFRIVCTFGTGGTSGGLSRYLMEKYGKKSLHVVFPLGDQDVAGIRTKGKAAGLRFYEPERYAGQHEVDFGQAKRLLNFFVDKGHDIGESSALALYAVMQMANFGGSIGGKFVVIVADGIQKYKRSLETVQDRKGRLEVPLKEAVSNIGNYNRVVWIHTIYTPRKEGIELIAKSLGVNESRISVPKASEVEQLLATQQISKEIDKALGGPDAKPLLVCMMGNTSLRVAQVLAEKGIVAESLTGGISALSQGKGKQISELVRMATE